MLRAALVESLPDGEIGLRNFEEGANWPKGIGFRGLGFDAACVGQRNFREASQKAAPGTGLRNSGLGGMADVRETRDLDVPESALFAKRRCGGNGQEVCGGDFGW